MAVWVMVNRLQGLIVVIGMLLVAGAQAGWAEERSTDPDAKQTQNVSSLQRPLRETQRLSDLMRPASTVPERRAQVEAATVRVTGVQLNPTGTKLEITLETSEGKPLQVDTTKFRTEGNSLIADIPAVLALPTGQPFTADKPTADIATVQVVQQDSSSIRISVTGSDALPKTEVSLKAGTFAYSLNPEAATPEIEINVVGLRNQRGYKLPNATTATKTDTLLQDIPQSIQVVPPQVLEDRKPRTLIQAVETVSGVGSGGNSFGVGATSRIIRGFNSEGNFRNGFRDVDGNGLSAVSTIDRIEILKGPASILFGAVEPGGIVNITTKQPLGTPSYRAEFEAGNYGFYQPTIDLSGPITDDRKLLYRLIGSYQGSGSFVNFANSKLTTIAPSITAKLDDRTNLNIYYEYIKSDERPYKADVPVFSDNTFRLDRSFYAGYPDLNAITKTTQKIGYTVDHQLNDNWQIRNNLAVVTNSSQESYTYFSNLANDRTLEGSSLDRRKYQIDNYFGQIDLQGKFKTGDIAHQILIGFDTNRNVETYEGFTSVGPGDLDLQNPNYNTSSYQFTPNFRTAFFEPIQSYGVFLQDRITIADNLKLLVGGRLDWVNRKIDLNEQPIGGTDPTVNVEQNDSAFSPQIGIVYQPSKTVAFYTSYSQSFTPTFAFSASELTSSKPTRGAQYEAGVKANFLDGKLLTTLSAYQVTKSNVTTADPNNPAFSIQVGEQQSKGIELDVAGEILPGWKVIGSYAYTDAVVSKDNTIAVGNRLNNVPANQASLWTTYEIQQGNLKGLGFGLGLFYVGERQGDLDNTYSLSSYLRPDLAVYYRKDGFRAGINIRNLFDLNYQEFSYGRLNNQIGSPFTISSTVSWEF